MNTHLHKLSEKTKRIITLALIVVLVVSSDERPGVGVAGGVGGVVAGVEHGTDAGLECGPFERVEKVAQRRGQRVPDQW